MRYLLLFININRVNKVIYIDVVINKSWRFILNNSDIMN